MEPYPPINFVYRHLHDSIRAELASVSQLVLAVEADVNSDDVLQQLTILKARYQMLEQINRYHSSVEDEVVYPALEYKVRNVTQAYSVEHDEEELLFDHLQSLIARAIAAPPSERGPTIHEFVCKVEEVHVSLHKHLRKEEEQLFPLLLQHFTFEEQAELVVQFVCCIPVSAVKGVLAWLKKSCPAAEQAALCFHVTRVSADNDLRRLLNLWLQPEAADQLASSSPPLWPAHPPSNPTPDPPTSHTLPLPAALPASTHGSPPQPSEAHAFASSGAGAPAAQAGAVPAAAALAAAQGRHASHPAAAPAASAAIPPSGQPPTSTPPSEPGVAPPAAAQPAPSAALAAGELFDPLDSLVHLHAGILLMLRSLMAEVRDVHSSGAIRVAQVESLVDRRRFLCAISSFHRLSEHEFVYPAARELGHGVDACLHCEKDHREESELLTRMGCLLADLESCIRRSSKETKSLLSKLLETANAVCAAMENHIQREERELLPELRKMLNRHQKHGLVWSTLQAMPLRLLERVMPWLAHHLGARGIADMMQHLRVAEPCVDDDLVCLLHLWAVRALPGTASALTPPEATLTPAAAAAAPTQPPTTSCTPTAADIHTTSCSATPANPGAAPAQPTSSTAAPPPPQGTSAQPAHTPAVPVSQQQAAERAAAQAAPKHAVFDLHLAFPVITCCPAVVQLASCQHRQPRSSLDGAAPAKRRRVEAPEHPASLRQSDAALDASTSRHDASAVAAREPSGNEGAAADAGPPRACMPGEPNPIDHIFQFHKALRRELAQLEKEAKYLQLICDYPERAQLSFETLLQRLEGRFHFLGGIYQAHSHAEDDVVFPALEAKDALRNISHFYVLDHQQEQTLFAELLKVINSLQDQVRRSNAGAGGDADEITERRALVSKLRQKCAVIRCNLETHVRAEEAELWPLFAEHFTIAEQSQLVGTIIGRTGAEVLQALIPWVMGSFSDDETGAMIDSLREATKNTRFDKWMGTMLPTLGVLDLSEDASFLGFLSSEDALPDPLAPPGAAAASAAPGGAQLALANGASDAAAPTPAIIPLVSAAQVTSAAHDAAMVVDPATVDSATVADTSEYRVGWEDIFRMNATQLEAAAAQASHIPSLEQKRRNYLAHNLMVSRFVVAQQQRMRMAADAPAAAAPAAGAAAQPHPTTAQQAAQSAAASACPACQPGAPCGVHSAAALAGAGGVETATTHCCPHYHCNCQLVSPCCGSLVTCRLCHDEASLCNKPFDRYAVEEMVCQLCMTQQPVGQHCTHCKASMARYYCGACHLFDDEPGRAIYHCPFCNVCRRGQGLGIDFFHCMQCNSCMSLALFNKHKCRERCMESNCPLCHENLFASSQPVKEMPCGHFMHSACFAEYTEHFYTCPICCRSVGDLSLYFRMLDSLLAAETLPPELASLKQKVHCNDCGANQEAPFHFVYHKCPACSSYNTRVL